MSVALVLVWQFLLIGQADRFGRAALKVGTSVIVANQRDLQLALFKNKGLAYRCPLGAWFAVFTFVTWV